jgi:hypothetical protein
VTWEKKRVLVTVKAYPEKSKKYGCVFCVAGITDEGDWIRLYPMPFATFLGVRKIKKYDWIEAECKKVTEEKLGRKESYRVRPNSVTIVDRTLSEDKIRGKVLWEERNRLVLPLVSPSLDYLESKYTEDHTSLGLIKPKDLLNFYTREPLAQPPEPKEYQKSLDNQIIPIVDSIPHIFAYQFRCGGCRDGPPHDIMCEDWELFESYRAWWKYYPRVDLLWEKLHKKFYDYMLKQDLYFFMGMHSLQPTWLIIGLYYPPKEIMVKKEKISTLQDWTQ